jgi:glycosyltransferase involved in cell wall biosynthesis
MRKVLVLAYRFPPQGGGGVQRTLKFVRYIRGFGWQPVVHTVRNPFWPFRDEALQEEIPADVQVYRTRTFEFERLERTLGSLLGNSTNGTTPGTTPARPLESAPKRSTRGGKLASLQRFVHQRVLMPDPQIAWLPWAFLKTLYIARKENIDLIYSSSPPNSSQVLGLWLKRFLKKPWVVDFRDPWTDGVRRKQVYAANPSRRRREESWERAVAEKADYFIVTTEKNQEQFLAKYPFLAPKLTTLTNGFDPEDFAHIRPGRRFLSDGYFHLTLTGNVETMFDATPFFRAVRAFLAQEPDARTHFRINFVGTKRGKYDQTIHELQLDAIVNYIGYVPHSESVQYLADSDVLFLCQIPEYESAVVKLPGKLFEYLYMKKPILALTLPGVTTSILDRTGLGVVAHPNDEHAITRALGELYRQWRTTEWRFSPNQAAITAFDRVRLAERLARIFDHVMTGAGLPIEPRKDMPRVPASDTANAL